MMKDQEAARLAKPRNSVSYNHDAYLLADEDDYAAALPFIEKKVDLGGDDVGDFNTYGHVLMGLGRIEKAGASLALAAVRAEQRLHRHLDQEAALAVLQALHHPEDELDAMILANIRNSAQRRRLVEALQVNAVPWSVPGFELIVR